MHEYLILSEKNPDSKVMTAQFHLYDIHAKVKETTGTKNRSVSQLYPPPVPPIRKLA